MTDFIKGLELDLVDLNGKFVVIEEEAGGESNFCLSCLMWSCLSEADNGLLLVAAHRSFNHYYHVGMKLGFNLTRQAHRAAVLELRTTNLDNLTNSSPDDPLKRLLAKIDQLLGSLKVNGGTKYLFIDNLSSLLFCGFTPCQIKLVVHYLRKRVAEGLTVVLSIQTSPGDAEETEVAAFLGHVADLYLHVAPLRTGSSQAVSGSIELTRKDLTKIEGRARPELYHYKLSERNVKVFRPGNI